MKAIEYKLNELNTLTDFRLKCFKIMASKTGFFENYAIVAMQSDIMPIFMHVK